MAMNQTLAQTKQPTAPLKSAARRKSFASLYRGRWMILMMIPGLLYYLLFHYLPMAGILIAFQDYNLMKGIWKSPWVGFEHFRTMFQSPDFPQIMKNTLLISIYRMIFNMIPDMLLALLLNEIRSKWFKKVVQSITYGPHFLSWIIVYGIVFSFFAPGAGLVTTLFREWGWGELNLLTDPDYFRPLLVVSDLWKNVGFGAIIYLAALGSINPELYEAAAVDGAGRWRKMWNITLPGIRSVFVLLLILRMGSILDAGFDQVYIFLNARVFGVGDIIDTWVFRQGLEQLNFSIAAATGVFKSLIGLIFILGANKIAKKVGGSGIW